MIHGPPKRVRPLELSIGGVSKKARKNRYHYRLVIPDKGIYRATRADDKPWWMWHEEGSQCWYAGPERDSAPPGMTPAMFDDSHIDISYVSPETVVRPGPHSWHAWDDSNDDWRNDPYEFTTEVNNEALEWGLCTPGEVLCFGWYDPDSGDDDNDDIAEQLVGTDESGVHVGPLRLVPSPPLRGIWLDAPPPPPPPLPAPAGCPTLPQPPVAAPTTPPEAFMTPKAAPSATASASESSATGAKAKSRWGPSSHRSGS
jgi:hypothetical protein